MNATNNASAIFSEFKSVAVRFCDIVNSSEVYEKTEFLLKIYAVLPERIQQGVKLPDLGVDDDETAREPEQTRLTDREWEHLDESLKAKLGGWNLYMDVFDPTRDNEAIRGSLADDIADIYRDVKEGIDQPDPGVAMQRDTIWTWRLLYYSHWGQHAMGALRTIHWLLANEPEFVSFH